MDFVGRKDFQAKVRGQRVELGEVEVHLFSYPAIAARVVVVPKSGVYRNPLLGIVQLRESSSTVGAASQDINIMPEARLKATQFKVSDLSEYLKQRLPGYMVPNNWLVVDMIPLSASAKVDRKRVTAWLSALESYFRPEESTAVASSESIALKINSVVVSMVANDYHELHASLAGQDASLSDLGLDSIQLISLSMSIQKEYGVKVGIERLTHVGATIRDVADHIEKLSAGTARESGAPNLNIMNEFRMLRDELKRGALTPKHWISECACYRRHGLSSVVYPAKAVYTERCSESHCARSSQRLGPWSSTYSELGEISRMVVGRVFTEAGGLDRRLGAAQDRSDCTTMAPYY